MLYLNRKPGEAVIINHSIEVRVVEVRGRTVKLGLTFPPEATVLREEVFEAIKQANRAALDAVRALPAVGGCGGRGRRRCALVEPRGDERGSAARGRPDHGQPVGLGDARPCGGGARRARHRA